MASITLIFIPDISGFTNFVNKTAIEHSRHIISELLEIIINANSLEFKISEIEGDAVLFYKQGNIPSTSEVFNLSKEMFLRFHSHLKSIEETNVCQCGACKSASQLSLKFISHIGQLDEMNVTGFSKLIGSDLIYAHRLLKNSIKSNEYLLFSDKYFNEYNNNLKLESWANLETTNDNIENFGKVSTKYINFNPLIKEIPKFIEENSTVRKNKKPDIFVNIKSPILIVHEAITKIEAKYDYVPGIRKVVSNNKINRINSSHTCVFDNLEIHFVTKNHTLDKNEINYSEEAELQNGYKFITDFELKDKNNTTDLAIYYLPSIASKNEKISFFKSIKNSIFLRFIIFQNKKNINVLKKYCESVYKDSLSETTKSEKFK